MIRRFGRVLWLILKYSLAALGAYLLIGNYVLKWGWPATLWLLGAPILYGLVKGFRQLWKPGPPRSD